MNWRGAITVSGAALLGLVLLGSLWRLQGASPRSLRASDGSVHTVPVRPNWNGVLPDNIADQQLPMVRNPHYGVHVVALGKNGSLWHQFQTGPLNTSGGTPTVPMSDWHCLTPNPKLIFGNAPALATNADGRIELFVGYKPDSLDIWQMYQTDPKNPLAWSTPRAPYCDPAQKSCNECLAKAECRKNFWTDGFVWTTSQQSLWLDPSDHKLRLSWRNFDGHVFEMQQSEPNNSSKWPVGSVMYEYVME
mmetsp:Transcript_103086/g.183172  ORF Transcript_103086/g.183172 Transcript_103086/m.183172 type:complete len:248 (-) Transcript_103086:45-788(-)